VEKHLEREKKIEWERGKKNNLGHTHPALDVNGTGCLYVQRSQHLTDKQTPSFYVDVP